MELLPCLPLEIVLNILSRFPISFIGKITLISKDINKKTYQSYFKALQAQHDTTTSFKSGFLLQTFRLNKHVFTFVSLQNNNLHQTEFSLDFLPNLGPHLIPDIIAVDSDHGFILCKLADQIYYYKPMTKHWKLIPLPMNDTCFLNTVIKVLRSSPLHFKIVGFTDLACHVFDSETWRWKQMAEDVLLPPLPTCTFLYPPVSASGAIHWLRYNTIYGFHLEEERWSEFSLPDPMLINNKIIKVVEYEGKLVVIGIAEPRELESLEVWVMEEYERKVWNKIFIIEIKCLEKELYCFPIGFDSSDIVVMWEREKRLIYFYSNRNSHRVFQLQTDDYILSIYPFSTV